MERAHNKAPLYTSLAHLSFGYVEVNLDQVLPLIDNRVDTKGEPVIRIKKRGDFRALQDEDVDDSRLGPMIVASLKDRVQGHAALPELNSVTDGLPNAARAVVYLSTAALIERPEFAPAWFQLAKHTSGKLRGHAAAGLSKCDPQNAIAYYLRAVAEVDQGNLATALEFVQTGNGRSECSLYDPPLPDEFTFKYPNNELCQEFGVAGRPVSHRALLRLSEMQEHKIAWADPFHHGLRDLSRSLVAEGTRLIEAGQATSGIVYFEATYEMGHRLIGLVPSRTLIVVVGIAMSTTAGVQLEKAYATVGDEAGLESVQLFQKRRQVLHDEMDRVFDGLPKRYDYGPILRDEPDYRSYLERGREGTVEALAKSGIVVRPGKDENELSPNESEVNPSYRWEK